jgi:hypothetical protein
MPNVEITVIDRYGGTATAWAQQTYPDHLLAISVWDMVDKILTHLSRMSSESSADPVAIGLLRIVGHGTPGQQRMGNSEDTWNPRQIIGLDRQGHLMNRATLIRLRGCFSNNSVVELHGCSAGRGPRGAALVQALRALWGVQVRASSVDQDAGTPGMELFARLPSFR